MEESDDDNWNEPFKRYKNPNDPDKLLPIDEFGEECAEIRELFHQATSRDEDNDYHPEDDNPEY